MYIYVYIFVAFHYTQSLTRLRFFFQFFIKKSSTTSFVLTVISYISCFACRRFLRCFLCCCRIFFFIGNILRLKYITDVNEKNVLERAREKERDR